ncbi:hypothetical protein AAF712_012174, partial [Marasmius tenuissimus]
MVSRANNKSGFRSIETRYRSQRHRRPSEHDREGEIYLLQGEYLGKTFVKIGRSIDSDRRLEQHTTKCKGVEWTMIGAWDATHYKKS